MELTSLSHILAALIIVGFMIDIGVTVRYSYRYILILADTPFRVSYNYYK